MKPSHFTTPRSQDECQFAMNADPIELPNRHPRRGPPAWAGRLTMAAGIIALIAAVIIVAVGALK